MLSALPLLVPLQRITLHQPLRTFRSATHMSNKCEIKAARHNPSVNSIRQAWSSYITRARTELQKTRTVGTARRWLTARSCLWTRLMQQQPWWPETKSTDFMHWQCCSTWLSMSALWELMPAICAWVCLRWHTHMKLAGAFSLRLLCTYAPHRGRLASAELPLVLGPSTRGTQLGFSEVYDALKPRSEENLCCSNRANKWDQCCWTWLLQHISQLCLDKLIAPGFEKNLYVALLKLSRRSGRCVLYTAYYKIDSHYLYLVRVTHSSCDRKE
jgi:hypothetical protein